MISNTGSSFSITDLFFENIIVNGTNSTGGVIGTLEGSLSNISVQGTINGRSDVGGIVGQANSSNITNCRFSGSVTGSSEEVGGIVGYLNDGILNNATVNGSVSGYNSVGGVVGKSEGTIQNCISNVTVNNSGIYTGGIAGINNGGNIFSSSSAGTIISASDYTGGLCGYSGYGGSEVTDCSSSCTVQGGAYTGGLIGFLNQGNVEKCYSVGQVSGYSNCGGLIGFAGYDGTSYVSKCFSTSNVSATTNYVGGLIGRAQGIDILNCFARGSVNGKRYAGGLVGRLEWNALVEDCYSTGLVNSSNTPRGGLIGSIAASTVLDSYWDRQTSGLTTSNGGTGRNTNQMLTQSTYSGWDFTQIWHMDSIYNDGYPYLLPLASAWFMVWTGNTNSQWELAGNWSLNRIPMLSDNIIIPNVINKPILNSEDTIKSLTVQPDSRLTISQTGKMTVTTIVTNSSDTNGLIIESGPTGTGSLIFQSTGIKGTFRRYISGMPEAWHSLSSPMQQQSISPEFTPVGTYGDGTGYALYYWHEPDTSWIYYNHPTTWQSTHGALYFKPGCGYLVSYQSLNPTRQFTGVFNSGTQSVNLTKTGSSAIEYGYNLAGNPYPSSIDWKAATGWDRTVLEQSGGGYNLWIWNDTAYNYGVYNSASMSDAGTLGTGRFIAPTQAFFVKAAQNGQLSMNHAVRIHSGSGNWLKGTKEQINSLSLTLTSSGGSGSDQILVEYGHPEGTGGAEKKFSMVGTAPSLYIPYKYNDYSLRHLTTLEEFPVVPVSFIPGNTGEYAFHASFDKSVFNLVRLKDLQTNVEHDFLSFQEYRFKATPGDDPDRFVLQFIPGGFANPYDPLPAYLYSSGKTLYADLRLVEVGLKCKLVITDLSGRIIHSTYLQGGSVTTMQLPWLKGIYIVHLSAVSGVISAKVWF
ncbi:MAG TPA: GLUG motif-containing protein [Bacteroidales bacterium]|nr:GLUG motif-containing protein [Bacteroidales bacterium]